MDLTKQQKIENVFDDYIGRRRAVIQALIEEKDKLFEDCDPENDELCLYGYPDGTWKVARPAEMLPTQLPEPVRGINFAREGMENQEWRLVLAAHCEAWLISITCAYGTQYGLDKNDRMELFEMINDLPTVCETVKAEDELNVIQSSNNNRIQSSKKTLPSQFAMTEATEESEEDLV